MKDKLIAVKNAVAAKKTEILTATAVIAMSAVAIQARAIHEHNEFLKENDLYDKYHLTDWE